MPNSNVSCPPCCFDCAVGKHEDEVILDTVPTNDTKDQGLPQTGLSINFYVEVASSQLSPQAFSPERAELVGTKIDQTDSAQQESDLKFRLQKVPEKSYSDTIQMRRQKTTNTAIPQYAFLRRTSKEYMFNPFLVLRSPLQVRTISPDMPPENVLEDGKDVEEKNNHPVLDENNGQDSPPFETARKCIS